VGKGAWIVDQTGQMTLTFRCPAALEPILPRPMPAVRGLPDWFKASPQKAFSATAGKETPTVKKCPPFVDAMIYGFLIPLAIDLEVRDGEFSWDFEVPRGYVSEFSHSPIGFHDPAKVTGTPFFEDDRFIIKFSSFWTIQAPAGYSLLFTHPVNRTDLPFTTLTGLVDCDSFHDSPLNFPARWHDAKFNGVLPKGTPVAQCLPVKRESWIGHYETFSDEDQTRLIATRDKLAFETGVYRRRYRAPKY
jgi:hypothetical protein